MSPSEVPTSSNPFQFASEQARDWWWLSWQKDDENEEEGDGPVTDALCLAALRAETMETNLAYGMTLAEAWSTAQATVPCNHGYMMAESVESWAFDILVHAWAMGKNLEELVNSRWKARKTAVTTRYTSTTLTS